MTPERKAGIAMTACALASGVACAEPRQAGSPAASTTPTAASPRATRAPSTPRAPRLLFEAPLGPFGDGGQDFDGDGLADIVISNRNLHRDHPDGSRTNSVTVISPCHGTLREWAGGPGFGYRVATSADLDGDAHPDVLVSEGDTRIPQGPSSTESPASRVLGFSGRNGEIASEVSGLHLGDDIAALGDLDGDGLADYGFTIGAELSMPTGGPYPQDGFFGFEVRAGGSGKCLLQSTAYAAKYITGFMGLRGIGDLDLDGTPDVAAALPGEVVDGWSRTRIVVISGSSGETLAEVPSSFVSNEAHESFAAAGDVDGDGLPDLVLGSAERSSARVISLRDNRVLFEFRGFGNDAFGWSVAGLGDADGDSIPDFAVGAPLFETRYQGLAYVRIISGADGRDLALIEGDREIDGIFDKAYIFGICVRAAGDVDGDGLADVLIGEDRQYGTASPDPDRVVVIGLTVS